MRSHIFKLFFFVAFLDIIVIPSIPIPDNPFLRIIYVYVKTMISLWVYPLLILSVFFGFLDDLINHCQ